MKICWDNLEELKYNKKTGKWYKNKGTKYDTVYIYMEKCKGCGDPFLSSKKNGKGKYCCIECIYNNGHHPMLGKHHTERSKKKMRIFHKSKKLTDKHKQNISKSESGKNHYNWKGGYKKKNIPLYDTYAYQINWCESENVRRNKEDPNILEVKCTYCGRWYIPKQSDVNNRVQSLKGNRIDNGEQRLYCSNKCKKVCPIYGKTPEQLMKEDAIRAGRLGWLELNREVQPELRKMVLERDGYQCVKCGIVDKSLHCHHIHPVSTDPLESADMDNCITLCVDCHKEAHQQDGCRLGQLRTCIEYK